MTADSPCIHQTVQALNFWQNTSSTIVGIRRGNELLLSLVLMSHLKKVT